MGLEKFVSGDGGQDGTEYLDGGGRRPGPRGVVSGSKSSRVRGEGRNVEKTGEEWSTVVKAGEGG